MSKLQSECERPCLVYTRRSLAPSPIIIHTKVQTLVTNRFQSPIGYTFFTVVRATVQTPVTNRLHPKFPTLVRTPVQSLPPIRTNYSSNKSASQALSRSAKKLVCLALKFCITHETGVGRWTPVRTPVHTPVSVWSGNFPSRMRRSIKSCPRRVGAEKKRARRRTRRRRGKQ